MIQRDRAEMGDCFNNTSSIYYLLQLFIFAHARNNLLLLVYYNFSPIYCRLNIRLARPR